MGARIDSNDQSFRNAALESHAVDDGKKLELEGPDARQVERAQKDAVLPEGLKHLGTEAATKAAEKGAEKLAELAISKGAPRAGSLVGAAGLMLSPIGAGLTLVELLQSADKEAAELHQAHNRDAVTLAAVDVGAEALPAGYVQHMQKELGVSKGGATKIMENLMHSHGAKAWKAIKASTEHLIHQGQALAKKLGIHDDKSLKARLANRHSNFAAAYHGSLALRIGVQSAIWSAQHPSH